MSPIHSAQHTQSSAYSIEPDTETPHSQETHATPPPPTQLEGNHSTDSDDDERMSVLSQFTDSSMESELTQHAGTSSSNSLPADVPLKRPPDPKFQKKPDNQPGPADLTQRTSTSIAAKPDENRDGPYPPNLSKLVDQASPYGSKKPQVQDVQIQLGKYKNTNRTDNFPDLEGGNQGGLMPGAGLRTDVPKTADYQERRPEQLLSHMSSVMMYQAKKEGQNPTEVQFGYVQNKETGKVSLYSSTNDKKTQDWLGGALNDPLKHVKAAATQTEDKDVQRNALKLLYFQENQQQRRTANDKANSSDPAKHSQINDDLDLTDKMHQEMFTGTHHVVKNMTGGTGQGRHAEQNVAEAMHQDMQGQTGSAEIAGTKIRCFSCSSSLGPSLKDENEQFYVAGKAYLAQSSTDSHRDLLSGTNSTRGSGNDKNTWTGGTAESDGRGRTRVHVGPSDRSQSTSPARLPNAADPGPSSTKRPREEDVPEGVPATKKRGLDTN